MSRSTHPRLYDAGKEPPLAIEPWLKKGFELAVAPTPEGWDLAPDSLLEGEPSHLGFARSQIHLARIRISLGHFLFRTRPARLTIPSRIAQLAPTKRVDNPTGTEGNGEMACSRSDFAEATPTVAHVPTFLAARLKYPIIIVPWSL